MNLRFRDERAVQQPTQLTSLSALAPATCIAASSAGGGGGATSGGGGATSGGGSPAGVAAPLAAALSVGGACTGVVDPGLTAWQRGLYCAGAVLLRYSWARLGHHAALAHWGDAAPGSGRVRWWAVLRSAESAYRAAALLNLLAFLRHGIYRSLLERLLRARTVYQQPSAPRAISFEYLNRQLVWHELSELLLFLLPLVNPQAIRRALLKHLPRLPALMPAVVGAPEASRAAAAATGTAAAAQQPCGVCGANEVLVPYQAVPCAHLFCYYCLRSQCMADPEYTCPLCLARVEAMQRCRC